MNVSGEDTTINKYKSIFCTTYGPVLYSYVNWVIEDARKKGIKRLYFLSRDGWLMYKCANNILVSSEIEDIEIRYLKVSRYSLRSAQYHMMGKSCLNMICANGIDVTLRKILIRAGLTKEQQDSVINDISSVNILNIDKVLSRGDISRIRSELSQSNIFLEYVYDNSKKAYRNACGYLNQEGINNDESIAIVDSGWIGSIQESIREVAGLNELHGYYFGLYEIPRDVNANNYHTFYFGPKVTRGDNHNNKIDTRRKAHFANCLFEAIYSSPKGMCIGYEHTGEGYIPIIGNDNPNKQYMYAANDVIDEYDIFALYTGEVSCDKLLIDAMAYPIIEDIYVLEQLVFCDDVIEHEYQSIVRIWDINDVKNNSVIRRVFNKLSDSNYVEKVSAWPEASIVKCGYKVKHYLRQERLYKRLMYIRKAVIG